MKRYVLASRTAVVVLGSALLIQGTDLGDRLVDFAGLRLSSYELLYSDKSPLQRFGDSSLEEQGEFYSPPRTDISLRTPVTPFGAGDAALADGTFEYAIERGDTLSSIWGDIGGQRDEAQALIDAFKEARVSAHDLKVGETIEFTRQAGEIVQIKRKLSGGASLILTGGPEQGYVPRIDQARVIRQERKVSGTIFTSLVDSANSSDIPYAVVDDFVDLFSNRVEFRRDLQPGDTFSVIFEESFTEDGEQLQPGAIRAAALKLGGKLMAVVRDVAPDGTVRYFDENGQMPTKAFLRYPVQYTRISSVFSTSRFHPVLHISRPHNGVDFSAPIGTPIRTVGDGVVVAAGYSSSMGNMVKIAHDSRYTTEYMHLNKIAAGIKKGSRVTRGTVIGTLGKTGLATGPHLHFGLFDNGKYIDPLKAKIMQSPDAAKPSPMVIATIADLKKMHDSMSVASIESGKPRA
jgi:murein DD-endopeptidase MepM/ murein hydrolase activator NlpD